MRKFPHFCSVVAFFVPGLCAEPLAQSSPATERAAHDDPAPTVAEDAALLDKGRLGARRRALARLATNPDPEADTVLLAQFERYHAAELPPALWLDFFEA